MFDYYIDANGTDGSDPSKIDRVYPDGRRIPLSQPEPKPLPDWISFRLGFLNDAGYKRVRSLVDLKLVIDLQDVVSSEHPSLEIIQKCWNAVIDAVLVNKPTTSEISTWNKLAKDTSMNFSFSSNGKIVVG
jgi:hypothetical protein